jgi:hypothetical protein
VNNASRKVARARAPQRRPQVARRVGEELDRLAQRRYVKTRSVGISDVEAMRAFSEPRIQTTHLSPVAYLALAASLVAGVRRR